MTDSFQWVLCPACNHKVHRERGQGKDIEVKCSSCKAVVLFPSQGEAQIVSPPKFLAKQS
jgi:phage FluMu protein Com